MPYLDPRSTAPRARLLLASFVFLLASCGDAGLEPEPTHFETIISGPAGIELAGELFECFLLESGQPLATAATLLGITDGTPDRILATASDPDVADVLGVRLHLTKTGGAGVLQAEIRRNAELESSGLASKPGDGIQIGAGDPDRC